MLHEEVWEHEVLTVRWEEGVSDFFSAFDSREKPFCPPKRNWKDEMLGGITVSYCQMQGFV